MPLRPKSSLRMRHSGGAIEMVARGRSVDRHPVPELVGSPDEASPNPGINVSYNYPGFGFASSGLLTKVLSESMAPPSDITR